MSSTCLSRGGRKYTPPPFLPEMWQSVLHPMFAYSLFLPFLLVKFVHSYKHSLLNLNLLRTALACIRSNKWHSIHFIFLTTSPFLMEIQVLVPQSCFLSLFVLAPVYCIVKKILPACLRNLTKVRK